MGDDRNPYRALFFRWLSPFAYRVGVPGGRERGNLPGLWLQPVAINEAPPGSLNGLLLEGADAPTSLLKFTGILDLLSPGGVAVLVYPRRAWSRADLHEVCRGGGFFLRAYRRAGRGQLVVLQKQNLPEQTNPDREFSVVLPFTAGPFTRIRESVTNWANFFAARDWLEKSQIVLVNDAALTNEELGTLQRVSHRGLLDIVHHYRSFGTGACVRTGILHALGRRVVLDETGGAARPREFLPLLAGALREERTRRGEGPVACHGYSAPERAYASLADRGRSGSRWNVRGRKLSQQFARALTGLRAPFAPLRLYPATVARELAMTTSQDSRYERLESGLALRRAGRPLLEIEIDLADEEGAPGPIAAFLFRTRLRRHPR